MTESGNLISEVLAAATAAMKEQGIPTPRLDAEVLLSRPLGINRIGLYTGSQKILTDEDVKDFWIQVKRRMTGEPVAYITGLKEFWSLPMKVSPAVLIPRPDTEILVEVVLKAAESVHRGCLDVVEIGTGSGAVSIALAKELENARITATDISGRALEIARENAMANGVADRISFLPGNLFQPLSGKFDIIAANPPYISAEDFSRLPDGIIKYEPAEALLAGQTGTEFHAILIREGWTYLKDGGWLAMEMGDGQKEKIKDLFGENGCYDELGFSADYAGLPRVAKARKKG